MEVSRCLHFLNLDLVEEHQQALVEVGPPAFLLRFRACKETLVETWVADLGILEPDWEEQEMRELLQAEVRRQVVL